MKGSTRFCLPFLRSLPRNRIKCAGVATPWSPAPITVIVMMGLNDLWKESWGPQEDLSPLDKHRHDARSLVRLVSRFEIHWRGFFAVLTSTRRRRPSHSLHRFSFRMSGTRLVHGHRRLAPGGAATIARARAVGGDRVAHGPPPRQTRLASSGEHPHVGSTVANDSSAKGWDHKSRERTQVCTPEVSPPFSVTLPQD